MRVTEDAKLEQHLSQLHWARRHGPIALIGAAVLALTRPYFLADTINYSNQIRSAVSHPAGPASPLWESGHLLWRPIGWLFYKVFGGLLPAGMPLPLNIAVWLIGFSALCAWIAVLLFHSIALRLGASRWVGLGLASALLCFNAFLDFAHAGASYVPAVMCLTVAVRILLSESAASDKPSAQAAGWAGVALAASALLWLPYVLCFPAVIFLASCWGRDRLAWPVPHRRRFALRVAGWTIAVLSAGYAAGIVADRLFSVSSIMDWFRASSHGIIPSPSLARTVFALARSIVYMDDGIQFKRFLLHDPYARVTIWSLLGTSLCLLGLVYLLLLGAGAALARFPRGRIALAVAFTAAVPTLLAANFFFESGASERYLFLLPFLGMGFTLGLANPRTPRLMVGGLWAALLAVAAWNLSAMSAPSIYRKEEILAQRARFLKPYLRPFSRVGLLSYRDDLFSFAETFPFHPLNGDPLPLFDIIEPMTIRVTTWRKEFATVTLAAWAQSGDVWLSKRVLAKTPTPQWDWAEGLEGSVPWKDFPAFFSRFEFAQEIGDQDGFVRLAPSQANRDILWGIGILQNHPAARFLPPSAHP